MSKSLVATSLLAVTVAMAPACATKKFVRTEVGGVNSKVDTLSGTLEQSIQSRMGQMARLTRRLKRRHVGMPQTPPPRRGAAARQLHARRYVDKLGRCHRDCLVRSWSTKSLSEDR